ncbi:hypothetical protein [Amycolatopsis echigonensis]|uniref:Uncharacterized protein n=1 Tax=Amycolatopsis echigonensis TaxID=2576905 RepID=A0A8E2B6L9_9PSEU|nr:hypothetical protein [Amycolatopsis echigonensis]MBB2503041.1 hypothetical protein [Amycolatopsis echigonensis]
MGLEVGVRAGWGAGLAAAGERFSDAKGGAGSVAGATGRLAAAAEPLPDSNAEPTPDSTAAG